MSKIIKPIGTIDRKLNKDDITELAKDHAHQIIAGGYDLLKVYVELKRYEVYLGAIIEELKEATLEKARETGRDSFEYANAMVTVGKRTKYQFETDDKWRGLNEELERIKTEKKAREQLLKQIQGESMEVIDQETGEIEKIIAPLREIIGQLRIKL